MRSPVWTLLWARWRFTRRFVFLLIPGMVVAVCLIYLTLSFATMWFPVRGALRTPEDRDGLVAFYILMLMGMACVTTGFGETQVPGFPTHGFSLPVRTAVLVACPMGFGVLCTALTYIASAWVVSRVTGLGLPLWSMALFLATITVGLQTVNWSLGGQTRRIFAGALVITALCTWLFLQWGFLKDPATFAARPSFSIGSYLFLTSICAVFVGLAIPSVDRRRHGEESRMPGPADLIYAAVRRLHWPVSAYRSPEQAQFWFEMKRFGVFLPIMNGAVLLAILLVSFVATRFPSVVEEIGALTAIWVIYGEASGFTLVLVGAGWAAGVVTKNRVVTRLSPFEMTRPLGETSLVRIKLKALFFSLLLSWP
ncbi:MAG TPA: hypothetical protein HPP83_12610, partial [Candidatus Hydrogenedentes bacterium]|nr:hypothetical protein [Candidatus Hydrogenedentota bacterium]